MTSTDRIELEGALIEALGPAALNCPDQDCRSLQWDDIVRVSDFDVTQASWCQAKVAGPPEPFAADIFKTYRAIALRAAKHLTADSSPTSVVSAVMKNLPGSRDWLGEYARTSPTSVRIQTATRAVSWLTRTAELLGTDSLADHRFDQNFDWKYPGHGLMLRTKVPLVSYANDASTPILVATSPSRAWDDSTAFTVLLWSLVVKRSSDHALVLVHSTGERIEIEINSMFERGIEAAARAALAVSQRDIGPDGLDRSPSFFTCQSCAWHDPCTQRQESEDRPPVRGGIRLGLKSTSG
jgi:hypothetical protein